MSAELPYSRPVRHRRRYRLRRNLTEAAALGLGVVIVIWTLTPIYNMVAVALESHGDVFTNNIWPTKPSLESFWIVVTQGYWYLEYFWQQFGNSLYVGLITVIAVVPTAAESGLPGFEALQYYGLSAPAAPHRRTAQ